MVDRVCNIFAVRFSPDVPFLVQVMTDLCILIATGSVYEFHLESISEGFQKLMGTKWDQDSNFNILDISISYRCTGCEIRSSKKMASLGETHCIQIMSKRRKKTSNDFCSMED